MWAFIWEVIPESRSEEPEEQNREGGQAKVREC